MTSKALVLDANILIRAVFGQRVRSLIHKKFICAAKLIDVARTRRIKTVCY